MSNFERKTHNITLTIRYDMPPEQWERLVEVYESMPGWRGPDKDGCPIWRPDGAEGGEISASAEPSGLVFSGDVNESTWGSWLQEFLQKSSEALGFEVKMPMHDVTIRILEARRSDYRGGAKMTKAASVEEAAGHFGLSTDAGIYFEVDFEEAKSVLVCVMNLDMAYHSERVPLEQAQVLAAEFFKLFTDESAKFYTNGEYGKPRTAPGVGPSWAPATDATFDTGVLVVTPTRVGCAWFMDED